MISCESVINRVYNFARVCPHYKQGIACPKQGNEIEVVVLNRVCILGYFLSQTGSGFQTLSGSPITKYGSRTPPPGGSNPVKTEKIHGRITSEQEINPVQIPHPFNATFKFPPPWARCTFKCPGYARGGMLRFRIDRRISHAMDWHLIQEARGMVRCSYTPSTLRLS